MQYSPWSTFRCLPFVVVLVPLFFASALHEAHLSLGPTAEMAVTASRYLQARLAAAQAPAVALVRSLAVDGEYGEQQENRDELQACMVQCI